MSSEQRKYVTLVGTRDTGYYAFMLMRLAGELYCTQGWRGRSGHAPGCDLAAYDGARRSPRFEEVGFDNYLPDATLFYKTECRWVRPDHDKNIFDATTFTDTYEQAQQLAFKARGSFHGLYASGIKLHTRNAYQVLGHGLDKPSDLLVCWATPVGSKGKVSGGTNTAVQIALSEKIRVINLYYLQNQAKLLNKAWEIFEKLSSAGKNDLLKCIAFFKEYHPDHKALLNVPGESELPAPIRRGGLNAVDTAD